MPIISNDDRAVRDLLQNARVIAVVGFSDDPGKPSHQITRYLQAAGYTVYPVNPTLAESSGERVYATLADVPEPIDIVDVFRRNEFLQGVFEEAIAVGAKAVWAQLGLHDETAARTADEAGLQVVTNACIKVEHARLVR